MKENPNLTRQEKIELLRKAIGEKTCFLCHGYTREEELKYLEIKNILPLCLKCSDRYQILRSLEEKCECVCEKYKC